MSDTISEPPVLINTNPINPEQIQRPPSPESNCAICLEEFTNKSFTNSCKHQFCYNCLKEWSRIKPECPLCKQRFHTIIYNVRSIDDFDEYHVNTSHFQFDQSLFNSFRNALDFRRNQLLFRRRMVDPEEFRPTMSPSPSMLYIREMNGFIRTADSIDPGPMPLEHEFRPPNFGLSRYRRDIYHRGRWVRPAQSLRIRHSCPEFYRLNPAQTHRLVPWLTRELNVLLDVSIDLQNLVQEILNLITLYAIQSRHFREAMRPHLGERTEHFVHEFYHFAVSPHDIVLYDIMAEYGPQDTRPMRLARQESSDSDSDVEIVNILRGNNTPLTFEASTSPGPSTSNNLPTSTVIEISDTSSSDDEVEIVSMISPESPETILIDSTTDDDEIISVPDGDEDSSPVKSESPKMESTENDEDSNQQGSSNSFVPLKFTKGFSPFTTISSTPSRSNSSSSSSPSPSSTPTPVYSSPLSPGLDSGIERKRTCYKRKTRKEKVKRRKRRSIESTTND